MQQIVTVYSILLTTGVQQSQITANFSFNIVLAVTDPVREIDISAFKTFKT